MPVATAEKQGVMSAAMAQKVLPYMLTKKPTRNLVSAFPCYSPGSFSTAFAAMSS